MKKLIKKSISIVLTIMVLLSITQLISYAASFGYNASGYMGTQQYMNDNVVDLNSGVPLANLTITAYNESGAEVASAVSDSTGYFEVNGLADGDYTLVIDGFTAMVRTIAVTVNGANVRISTKNAAVGIVNCDFQKDGVIDVNDYNMFMTKLGAEKGDNNYDANYDLDGSGVITAQDYIIFSKFFGVTDTNAYSEWTGVTDVYKASGYVAIKWDMSYDAIDLNSGGVPLANLTITAYNENGAEVASAVSDSKGYFEVDGLADGDYTFVIDGEAALVRSIAVTVSGTDVRMSAKNAAVGIVNCDYIKNGIIDADDYMDFSYHLFQVVDQSTVKYDLDGNGSINSSDYGRLKTLFGHNSNTAYPGWTLAVKAYRAYGYAGVKQSRSIDTVDLNSGVAIANLTVTVYNVDGAEIASVVSDSEGYFEVNGLPDGAYTFVIDGVAALARSITVIVNKADVIISTKNAAVGIVNCDYSKDGIIEGRDYTAFTAKFGAKAGDSNYDVNYDLNGDGKIDVDDYEIFTTFFGVGTINAYPELRTGAIYKANGYVGVKPDTNTDAVDLNSGAAIANLTIIVYNKKGVEVASSVSDSEGYFEVSALTNGTYLIVIDGATALARSITITVSGVDVEISTDNNAVGIVNCDFNKDGVVDIYDAGLLLDKFFSSIGDSKYDANYDLNGDGVIDHADNLIYINFFGINGSNAYN